MYHPTRERKSSEVCQCQGMTAKQAELERQAEALTRQIGTFATQKQLQKAQERGGAGSWRRSGASSGSTLIGTFTSFSSSSFIFSSFSLDVWMFVLPGGAPHG